MYALKPPFEVAQKRLQSFAFKRFEKGNEVLLRLRNVKKTDHQDYLQKLYTWFLAPFSLWPVDITGLLELVLEAVENKQELSPNLVMIIVELAEPPSTQKQDEVASYELLVQEGEYSRLLKDSHKYHSKESHLAGNPEFIRGWHGITKRFNVKKYQDSKGIIRRTLINERNMRGRNWKLTWDNEDQQFQQIFDTFCHRWVLYGMDKNKPLLQKLTANTTPLGTIIFIPSYWSFDPSRDVRWKNIAHLHRQHGAKKQGKKLDAVQQAHQVTVRTVFKLLSEAKKHNLSGAKLEAWLCSHLKLDPRSDRQVRRLIKEAQAILR